MSWQALVIHPGTEQLKILHLMFADDVMMFLMARATVYMECLDDFASRSGLHMNPTKSELFTLRVDQRESTAMVSYWFPSGKFPIHYLGLPFMSRKVKISEYALLMTKITMRFISWSAKLLSFAGRLQLLKSVIFSTVNFWISAFYFWKSVSRALNLFDVGSYDLGVSRKEVLQKILGHLSVSLRRKVV